MANNTVRLYTQIHKAKYEKDSGKMEEDKAIGKIYHKMRRFASRVVLTVLAEAKTSKLM